MKRLLIAAALFSPIAADAACVCRCVNGQVQAICENAIDMRPYCAPELCPIVPYSIKPIPTPALPPLGTKNCTQEQVLNRYTNAYEWRTLCR